RNPSNARARAGTAMNRPKPHDQFHLDEMLGIRMNPFVAKKRRAKLEVDLLFVRYFTPVLSLRHTIIGIVASCYVRGWSRIRQVLVSAPRFAETPSGSLQRGGEPWRQYGLRLPRSTPNDDATHRSTLVVP